VHTQLAPHVATQQGGDSRTGRGNVGTLGEQLHHASHLAKLKNNMWFGVIRLGLHVEEDYGECVRVRIAHTKYRPNRKTCHQYKSLEFKKNKQYHPNQRSFTSM